MRKSILAAAVAAAMSLLPLKALAADVMTHLTSTYVSDQLKAAGATDIKITKPEAGVEIVSFNDGSGPADFILLDCTAEGCTTLQMDTQYEKDARVTVQVVNAFNRSQLNVQAVQLEDGTVALRRLYVTDGGITEDNFKKNADIFLAGPGAYMKHVNSLVTASVDTQPAVKPLAAVPGALTLQTGAAATTPVIQGLNADKWLAKRPRRTLPR